MRMKTFLIDENVNQKAIRAIPAAQKGFDILFPESGGYKGVVDSALRARSVQEGRILVTCDRDFALSGLPLNKVPSGVLWIRPSPRVSQKSVGNLLLRFCEFLQRTFPANPYGFEGKIFEICEAGVRITTPQREDWYDF